MDLPDCPPGTEGYEEDFAISTRPALDGTKAEQEFQIYTHGFKVKVHDGSLRNMFERKERDPAGQWVYLCYPCGATCSGEATMQNHITGKKHMVRMEKTKVWPLSIFNEHPYYHDSTDKMRPTESTEKPYSVLDGISNEPCEIQSVLNEHKSSPLVGLEYLVELEPEEAYHVPQYYCLLCDKQGQPRSIINHLISCGHRCRFAERHYTAIHRAMTPFRSFTQEKGRRAVMHTLATRVEQAHGRMKPLRTTHQHFQKHKADIFKYILDGPHISENMGESFVEVVDEDLINFLSRNKDGSDSKKKEPSPPVVAAPRPSSASRVPVGKQTVSQSSAQAKMARHGSTESLSSFSLSSPETSPLLNKRQADSERSAQYAKRIRPNSPKLKGFDMVKFKGKLNLLERVVEKLILDSSRKLSYHEKNPEKHPLYPEEWKKFWNRRYKELQNENKDPTKFDFKPEWIVFWTKRLKELHDEEFQAHKNDACRRLNIPLEAVDDKGVIIARAWKDGVPPPQKIDRRRSPPLRRSPLRRSPTRRSPLRRTSPRQSPLRHSPSRRLSPRRSPRRFEPRRSPGRRSPLRRRSPPRRYSPSHGRPRFHRSPPRHRSPPPHRSVMRSDPRPESRVDVRPEFRADVHTESHADARTESRADARTKSGADAHTKSGADARSESRTDARSDSRNPPHPGNRSPPTRSDRNQSMPREASVTLISDDEMKLSEDGNLSPWGDSDSLKSVESIPAARSAPSNAPRRPPVTVAASKVGAVSSSQDNVVSVLRLLSALEDYLGSIGPRIVDLLAQALKMEKNAPNSSEELLLDEAHCVLVDTAKEKLKGALHAGLVPGGVAGAARDAITRTAALLHHAEVLLRERTEKEKAEKLKAGKLKIEKDGVCVAGVGAVEKAAIAQQIAAALIAQGKTDVTTEELATLVDAVIGMANAKRSAAAEKSGGQDESIKKVEATKEKSEPNESALQMLRAAYDETTRLELQDKPKLDVKRKENRPKEEDKSSMDGLSDSDLKTLLQNFKDLSSDEQHDLIGYLRKLESREPSRVERLRQFVNLQPPAPKNAITIPANTTTIDSDDDDYTVDDVFKSAALTMKENQIQQEMEVVQKSLQQAKPVEDATKVLASLLSSLQPPVTSLQQSAVTTSTPHQQVAPTRTSLHQQAVLAAAISLRQGTLSTATSHQQGTFTTAALHQQGLPAALAAPHQQGSFSMDSAHQHGALVTAVRAPISASFAPTFEAPHQPSVPVQHLKANQFPMGAPAIHNQFQSDTPNIRNNAQENAASYNHPNHQLDQFTPDEGGGFPRRENSQQMFQNQSAPMSIQRPPGFQQRAGMGSAQWQDNFEPTYNEQPFEQQDFGDNLNHYDEYASRNNTQQDAYDADAWGDRPQMRNHSGGGGSGGPHKRGRRGRGKRNRPRRGGNFSNYN